MKRLEKENDFILLISTKIMSEDLIRLVDTRACIPRAAQQRGVIITWEA